MIVAQSSIAKKYAKAFFNVFGPQISRQDFEQFCAMADFFEHNRQLLFFLSWPIIDKNLKIKALKQTLTTFKLNKPYDKLIELLAQDKRIFLIAQVLGQLCSLYKEQHKIMSFSITSSHHLNEQDLKILTEFLVNLTSKVIMYSYTIDKKLIAGIRLQSNTLLWEHSINKQLWAIKLSQMH